MRTLSSLLICLLPALAIAVPHGVARADDDPPMCRIVKIKNDAVSIEIPLRGKLVSEIHCRNDAAKQAKDYAAKNRTCDPAKKLEKTFQVSIELGTKAKHKSFTMSTGCPRG